MRAPEIQLLVTGLLAVIGIAIGIGQYGKLEVWARHQAFEAMQWKGDLPVFSYPTPTQKTQHHRVRTHAAAHREGN